MDGQHSLSFFHPLLLFFQGSVSTDKAMGVNPSKKSLFALLCPELLGPPPFKDWLASFGRIAIKARWGKIVFGKVRAAAALGHNVVKRQLLIPLAAVGTSAMTKRPSQWVVFKDALAKTALGLCWSEFNERMKEKIRPMIPAHKTIGFP